MKKTIFTLIAGLLVSCAWTLSAQAQLARTFVSTTGNDANTCDRDAPCRNFNEAISKTAAGGEVTALDSGSYGHITVRKSLTIQGAPGAAVMVSRTSPKNPVVFVDLETTMTVVLRNLQISKPHGEGPNKGIDFRSGGSLHVENCIISGFDFDTTVTGISALRPAGAEILSRLSVKDTLIRGNTVGVYLVGSISASIDNCRIENNALKGVSVKNTRTTISHSFVAGSSTAIEINDGATAYVESCTVTNNGVAIHALDTESPGAGVVYVSNTSIFGNERALTLNGIGLSFGNNRLANTINGVFTFTVPQQ